jgi:microcystin-dependent protein
MIVPRTVAGRRHFVTRITGYLAAVAGGVTFSGLRQGNSLAAHPPVTASRAGGENWVGEIVTIPYNFAPRGFVFCEGQKLPVSQNQALFSLLGTNYGGDGRTTFGLPDTRPLEADAKKKSRASRPPFRYAIALTGLYPSRS